MNKIDKIYHIADVHIRNLKRHEEYRQVFDNLIDYINSTKTENSIIYLAGDIVHNKIDMSPELIDIVQNFLKMCADTLPTVLIAGNHDMNLNSERMDALSPIVKSLNRYYESKGLPGILYWTESGIYELGDVKFGVYAITDPMEKWPIHPKRTAGDKMVALYHGPLLNAVTDLTTIMFGQSAEMFDGYDLALLGDIHKFQFMDALKTICYAGSLIQQDFGESPYGHGVVVWDMRTMNHEFVPIKNDCGLFTLDIVNDRYQITADLPKRLKVRIRHTNCTDLGLANAIKELGKSYQIEELIKQKVAKKSTEFDTEKLDSSADFKDISVQNALIEEFLKSSLSVPEDHIKPVLELNAELNKMLPVRPSGKSLVWKPISLHFSNMFSYGEGNSIDFSEFSGTYGIWAANAHGKSSLFDIVSFAIFDKATRATKASHIMNSEKNKFSCVIELELSGVRYFIERIGSRKSDGNVKVDVNFWTIDSDGSKVNLNGEDRDKTNFIIRDCFGTYDDFLMTTLSTQYDNQNFVEKAQKDRKELLYRFLDISIYEELFNIAKIKAKEYQVLVKDMDKENLPIKSVELQQKVDMLGRQVEFSRTRYDSNRVEWIDSIKELESLESQRLPIDSEPMIDISKVELDISNAANSLQRNISSIVKLEDEKDKVQLSLSKTNREIEDLNEYSNRKEIVDAHHDLVAEQTRIQYAIKSLDAKINDYHSKKIHLENHEYDPNCKYCTNNQFIKDATEAVRAIPALLEAKQEYDHTYIKLVDRLNLHQSRVEGAEKYVHLVEKKKELEMQLVSLENEIKMGKIQDGSIKSLLSTLNEQRDAYLKNQHAIETNKRILSESIEMKRKRDNCEASDVILNKELQDALYASSKITAEYELCTERLKTYQKVSEKFRIYELYMKATCKEGVPYKIVEKSLPVLESEVNSILSQIVDFSVKIDAVDEKYIGADVVYYGDRTWPIEITSGMERFVLSLAFRAALMQMTTLAKSNFMVIDEGFGVLDSNNILQIGKLFEYLKNHFDFIICVSHIDSMKDLTDKAIKISKTDGYSHIEYAG